MFNLDLLTKRIAFTVGLLSVSAFSFAASPSLTPDAGPVVSSLAALAVPIAAVGGAKIGVNVGIRGWKIINRLI